MPFIATAVLATGFEPPADDPPQPASAATPMSRSPRLRT
jgi:hypothetical protein